MPKARKTGIERKARRSVASAPAVKKGRKKRAAGKARAPKKICFVLSPFGGYYDRYYSDIYSPAIEAAGLEPHRADDLYRATAIVQDIWTYVNDAAVMIADLTGRNPNVFYELGLAHALHKPVILLTQNVEEIPFDLQQLRTIVYDTEAPDWAATLRDSITIAIEETLTAPSTALLQPFRHQPVSAGTKSEQQDVVMQQILRSVNQLRAEVSERDLALMRRSRVIPSSEAVRLISRYIADGAPNEAIVSLLTSRGAPERWVRQQIARRRGSEHSEEGEPESES